MRFAKGQSGNPSGRPKESMDFKEEAKKHGLEVQRFWLEVMRGKVQGAKVADQIKASELLANYGFGKPMQPLEHSGEVDITATLLAPDQYETPEQWEKAEE